MKRRRIIIGREVKRWLLHLLLGIKGKHWYLLPVDRHEWTKPKYGHQN